MKTEIDAAFAKIKAKYSARAVKDGFEPDLMKKFNVRVNFPACTSSANFTTIIHMEEVEEDCQGCRLGAASYVTKATRIVKRTGGEVTCSLVVFVVSICVTRTIVSVKLFMKYMIYNKKLYVESRQRRT